MAIIANANERPAHIAIFGGMADSKDISKGDLAERIDGHRFFGETVNLCLCEGAGGCGTQFELCAGGDYGYILREILWSLENLGYRKIAADCKAYPGGHLVSGRLAGIFDRNNGLWNGRFQVGDFSARRENVGPQLALGSSFGVPELLFASAIEQNSRPNQHESKQRYSPGEDHQPPVGRRLFTAVAGLLRFLLFCCWFV